MKHSILVRTGLFLFASLMPAVFYAQTGCLDPGNGSSGAYSATANTTLAGGTYNYTTFNINSGVTVNVTGTQPLIIHCTGAVTINGMLAANGGTGTNGVTFSGAGTGGIGVAGGANGGNGVFSASLGPLPGTAGSGTGGTNNQGGAWSGGGGSGYAAVGGSTLNSSGGQGGPAYGTPAILGLESGSGGGGGSGGYNCGSGGGGAGGGLIVIHSAVSITIGATGAITCNGGNGGSDGGGNCGGGGGGSGGSIWLASPSMSHGGALSCTGGAGGSSQVNYSPYWGQGATGSAGRIRLDYNGTLSGTGTTSPAVGAHYQIFATAIAGSPVTCNGGSNGSAVVTAMNGATPYTYAWSPSGGNGSTATGLTAGTYTCVITDATGCSQTQTVQITQPSAMQATFTVSGASCFGNCDGMASVTVTGGNGPYTYAWAPNGATTASNSNLCAGTYSCTITDSNGCTVVQVVTVTEPSALTASVVLVTDVSTCGGSDGAIDIMPAGGIPGYTYAWSNGPVTEDISGIPAGTYNCTVTDMNGCPATATATVNDPPLPVVTFQANMDTVCQTTQMPFALSGGLPAGGTYSGPGVSGGMFDPMQASIGYNVITYSYTDSVNCSASYSDSIYVDICSGIASAVNNQLNIYPEPNAGQFTLDLGYVPASPVKVEITNGMGQLVQSFTISSSVQQVDLGHCANGIYFVKINDGKSISVSRVTKQ